jgi:hypothetical protein
MRSRVHLGSLVVVLVLVAAVPAAGKKKTTSATPDDYSQLGAHSTLLGKLVLVNSNRSFLLQVEYEYYQAYGGRGSTVRNEAALIQALNREQQKLLKEQERILSTRNPIKRLQELRRFVAQMQQPGQPGHLPRTTTGQAPHLRMVKAKKNYDFQALDAVKVRTLETPVVLDARGNPRKLTEAENRAKKGPDPSLPGYTSSWSHLKPGLTVRVYFAPRKKPVPADTAKTKGKDKEKDHGEEHKPPVSMIVILED